ncbi:putative zinc finger, CCHC-type containing protein [Tanacetum coccineum]
MSRSNFIILVLYVDDILLESNNIDLLHESKCFLSRNFDMKDLDEASYVIGIEIHRDRANRKLGLSQKAYIERVLNRFNMQHCSPTIATVIKGDVFGSHQCPKTEVEYEEMNGNKSSTDQLNSSQQMIVFSLLTRTKIDIGEIIFNKLVARLNEVPRKKHMSYPRFIACVLEEKLGAKYAQDPSLGSTPWILSKPNYSRNPSEVTPVDLTTYMLRVVEQAKKSPTFSMEKWKKKKTHTMNKPKPKS